MTPLYVNIKNRRLELGLSQEDLARKMGYTSRSSIAKIEAGKNDIPQSKIKAFAKALETTPGYLMGLDESYNDLLKLGLSPLPEMVKRPRLGIIACGEPLLTEENFEGYDDVPFDVKCDFTLKCKGDSMINARINDGDIVYIKCQPTVENGQIAAVMVNGETTLKRVFIYENKVVLQAENPRYEPFIYVDEELNNIRILGKAVGFYSNL